MAILNPPVHLSDDPVATALRDEFARAGILSIALVGPPGAGKTSLIKATAERLEDRIKLAVLSLNPAAERDIICLGTSCEKARAVHTAIPHASDVRDALRQMGTYMVDLLLMESHGGIAGSPDLGQDLTTAVFSSSGGDDKAATYRDLVAQASAIVLTKTDLQDRVTFNLETFRTDIMRINPAAEFIDLSTVTGHGLGRWLNWLIARLSEKTSRIAAGRASSPPAEWYFG